MLFPLPGERVIVKGQSHSVGSGVYCLQKTDEQREHTALRRRVRARNASPTLSRRIALVLMPFGNSAMNVPEGQKKIAQRFNAGDVCHTRPSPEGTAEKTLPGVETPGYYRAVSAGQVFIEFPKSISLRPADEQLTTHNEQGTRIFFILFVKSPLPAPCIACRATNQDHE